MAGNLSDAGAAQVLEYGLTNTSVTRPTNRYVALYTSPPSNAGGGTEVAGFAYARQEVTFNSVGMVNTNALTFGPASGGTWGTVTHWGIFDNNGVFWAWGVLAAPKIIPNGTQLVIAAGSINASAAS